MKKFLIGPFQLLVELFVLIIFIFWFCKASEIWEPLIGIAVTLASLVYNLFQLNWGANREEKVIVEDKKIEGQNVVNQGNLALDKELYEKFIKILPTNGSIDFIKNNNFAGFSFELESLKNIREFRFTFCDAEHEFIDKELEKLRIELLDLIGQFMTIIGLKTFPTSNGRQTVPPEWEIDNQEEFWETVRKLESLSDQIYEKHQELIRRARSILY